MNSQKIAALQQFFDILSLESKTEIIEGLGAQKQLEIAQDRKLSYRLLDDLHQHLRKAWHAVGCSFLKKISEFGTRWAKNNLQTRIHFETGNAVICHKSLPWSRQKTQRRQHFSRRAVLTGWSLVESNLIERSEKEDGFFLKESLKNPVNQWNFASNEIKLQRNSLYLCINSSLYVHVHLMYLRTLIFESYSWIYVFPIWKWEDW